MTDVNEIFAYSLSGDVNGLRNAVFNGSIKKHWTNYRLKCGDTPLHVAARHGNLEIVR